uniref:Ubiquitin carboxyl-terminal hydrolase 7 n=1 Tax=Hirondellea gigas TaxID=1518452 RepID=A0A6A7G7H1_9CRUS
MVSIDVSLADASFGSMDEAREDTSVRQADDNIVVAESPDAVDEQESCETKESRTTTSYVWEVRDLVRRSRAENRILSEEFVCGGIPFRLLAFLKGNMQHSSLSLFLEIDKTFRESKHDRWGAHMQFEMVVINHLDGSKSSHSAESQHIFNARHVDRGFEKLVSLAKLKDPSEGFLKPDGSIQIKVLLKLVFLEEPRPLDVLPGYDSKKETGYVGLRNQGATCYMNSFLQTLFAISFLRKAVYAMPTENLEVQPLSPKMNDSQSTSVNMPLALQRLFYELQTRRDVVATRRLTKSFGWDNADAFQQHDVQEFSRILADVLEGKMAKTEVAGTIAKLFEGKYENVVECINVDFRSKRPEEYQDLSLTVRGCKDILESMKQFVEWETLEGDNKYLADGHGHQDARRGYRFLTFPPVLQIQLKRFEFDLGTKCFSKVNDKFIFYDELDLNEFISKDGMSDDDAVDYVYVLHSVLVHQGSGYGGHYQVFLRPTGKDQWYLFDDETVVMCDKKHAIEENFGGRDLRYPKSDIFKTSNAYMLVYVRRNKIKEFLSPVRNEEIPHHLIQRFALEEQLEEEARKKREDDALKTNLTILTCDQLASWTGVEIPPISQMKTVRTYKKNCLDTFKEQALREFGIPVQNQRYFHVTNRKNGSLRANRLANPSTMSTAFEIMQDSEKVFFVGNLPNLPVPTPHLDTRQPRKYILIFLKWFDPATNSLSGIGCDVFRREDNVSTAFQRIREMKDLPDDCNLLGFEEEHAIQGLVNRLRPDDTYARQSLVSGDIFCFQDMPPINSASSLMVDETKSPSEMDDSTDPTGALNVSSAAENLSRQEIIATFKDPCKIPDMSARGFLFYQSELIKVSFMPHSNEDRKKATTFLKSNQIFRQSSDSSPNRKSGSSNSSSNTSRDNVRSSTNWKYQLEKARQSLRNNGNFVLSLNGNTEIVLLLEFLQLVLNVPSERLKLYTSAVHDPERPDHRSIPSASTLKNTVTTESNRIFFQIMDFSPSQLQENFVLSCLWRSTNSYKSELDLKLLVPRTDTVKDVQTRISERLLKEKLISEDQIKQLRFFLMKEGKFESWIDEYSNLAIHLTRAMPEYLTRRRLVCEIIPQSEIELKQSELVWVNFVSRLPYGQTMGFTAQKESLPFSIHFSETETLNDVKMRIQTRFNLSSHDFSKWEFVLMKSVYNSPPVSNDDVLHAILGEHSRDSRRYLSVHIKEDKKRKYGNSDWQSDRSLRIKR